MAKSDFTVKKERYGHLYELGEYGEWLKDGKPDENLHVQTDSTGIFWLFDGNAGVGKLTDMGLDSNTWGTTEVIDTREETLPDGTIDRVSRVIYRTKREGTYCMDKHFVTKMDGVTLVRAYSVPALFERF